MLNLFMKNYLGNIMLGEGQFDNELMVGYLSKGYECSGFFPKEIIKEGRLEVEVFGLDKDRGLMVVKPVQGRFFETHGAGYVLVRLGDVVFRSED